MKDTYEVISLGKPLAGFSRKRVTDNLATLFQKDRVLVAPLVQGQIRKVQGDLSHKAAYTLHQSLQEAGLDAELKRIPGEETAAEFSLVPEGEETTPYQELAKRHQQGETVICKHCNCEQQIAPYCSECGKQLIAKAGAMPQQVTVPASGTVIKRIIGIFVVVLAAIAAYFYINQ